MPKQEPTLAEIHDAIVDLLRTEEIATLATIDSSGRPSASVMHLASDGLVAYMHTFGYTRKNAQMRDNPNVSYAISYLPPDGYAGRWQTRYLQVQGRASLVTDAAEIQHIAQLSLEQFPWASDTSLYDNLQGPDVGQQAFYRIDPVEGLWADNRVRLNWRVLLEFSDDSKSITNIIDYNVATGRRAAR